MPDKHFNEIVDAIFPDDKGLYIPYTIQILRKNDVYYVNLTYEEKVHGDELKFNEAFALMDKVAGIDVN